MDRAQLEDVFRVSTSRPLAPALDHSLLSRSLRTPSNLQVALGAAERERAEVAAIINSI